MAYRPVDDIQLIDGSMTEAYQLNLLLSDRIGWGEMATNQISWFIYRCLSTKLSGDVHDYLQTLCSLARISLGGLSHTSFTGFQFLVLPDQRCGFLTLAVS